jgi:hypothetical protein
MLTEDTIISEVKFDADGTLFIKRELVIYRDGIEISRTNNRESYQAGSSIINLEDSIQKVAAAVWDVDIVKKVQDKRNNFDPVTKLNKTPPLNIFVKKNG